MATSSFGRKFCVADNKVDEFVATVTQERSAENPSADGFRSRSMSHEEMHRYVDSVLKKS